MAYVYSGRMYTAKNKRRNNNGQPGLLHPQADTQTDDDPTDSTQVGYRYVMGERAGWGHDGGDIDEFAGIGTHVHEIGHLLGLNHGEGGWVGENPHTSTVAPHARPHTNATGANFVGWGIMQSATEGPELSSNGYHQGYGSCPLPVNPFYRMDLGWIDPPAITEGQQDYVLALGSVHRIAANKSQSLTRARPAAELAGLAPAREDRWTAREACALPTGYSWRRGISTGGCSATCCAGFGRCPCRQDRGRLRRVGAGRTCDEAIWPCGAGMGVQGT